MKGENGCIAKALGLSGCNRDIAAIKWSKIAKDAMICKAGYMCSAIRWVADRTKRARSHHSR